MSDKPTPDVSVIIVSFNTCDLMRRCLDTLRERSEGVTTEVIVVDNASTDGSPDMVERDYPDVRLIRSDVNLGFGPANNRGIEVARGRYYLLLNSDAFPEPGALRRAVEHMDASPEIGAGGARLLFSDGSWQLSARPFPTVLGDFLVMTGLPDAYPASPLFRWVSPTRVAPDTPADVDWAPGAFLLLRREVIDQVGSFDERYYFYYEEVDLCWRIGAAGHRVRYWPDVVVVHLCGESAKKVKRISFSGHGAQLTLWRMRSQLLFLHLRRGALSAWLTMKVEVWWRRLRTLKNVVVRGAESREKIEESRRVIELWKQAWRDTDGGRRSPDQPW